MLLSRLGNNTFFEVSELHLCIGCNYHIAKTPIVRNRP